MTWAEILRRRQRLPGLPYPVKSFGLPRKRLRTVRLGRLLLGATALLLAAACAEVELVSHAAKQVQPGSQPRGEGHYKIGNPYEIDGIWYYPAVDYGYRETGIAHSLLRWTIGCRRVIGAGKCNGRTQVPSSPEAHASRRGPRKCI